MATVTYKGIAFPFQIGATSFPAQATNEDLIKQSIVQIIMTSPGERYMRPKFGCGALAFVFEPNDEALELYIQDTVATAIATYEPRVAVRTVQVEREDNMVTVTVQYVILATGNTQQAQVSLGTT